jgi:hypothetical protein
MAVPIEAPRIAPVSLATSQSDVAVITSPGPAG